MLTLSAMGSGIQDAAGNVLAGDASETWVVLASPAPLVVSSLRADADPTSAQSINFIVTFNVDVAGVDTTDFALTTTGNITGATVSSIGGGSSLYTVMVDTGTGDGTLRLDVLNDGTITDATGMVLAGGTFTTGEAYTMIRSTPIYTVTPEVPTSATARPNVRRREF